MPNAVDRFKRMAGMRIEVRSALYCGFCGLLVLLLLGSVLRPSSSVGALLTLIATAAAGAGSVAALVFAPGRSLLTSVLTAAPLVVLMHGVIVLAAAKGHSYVRLVAGTCLGDAIRITRIYLLVEWLGVVCLGTFVSKQSSSLVPLWVPIALMVLVAAARVVL